MKMYILLKDSIPLGIAINSLGHGVLIAHLTWDKDEEYLAWLQNSFKKVTCKVDFTVFEKFKQFPHNIVVTESRLAGEETALIFKPRKSFPDVFKELALYK